jgi:hypothetical protein
LGYKQPSEDDIECIFGLRGRDGSGPSGSHVAAQNGDIEMESGYKGMDGKGDAIQVTETVHLKPLSR